MDTQAKETLAPPSKMEADILRNFYLSFKFSQGLPALQHLLMRAVASRHDSGAFKTEFPTAEVFEAKLKDKALKFKPPGQHSIASSEGIARNLSVEWKVQQDVFFKSDSDEKLPSDVDGNVEKVPAIDNTKLLLAILEKSMERDYHFIARERPNRENDSDKFESFVKTYLIDRTPTGSDQYDSLFAEIGEFIPAVRDGTLMVGGKKMLLMSTNLYMLSALWSEKNPNQDFFGQDATAR